MVFERRNCVVALNGNLRDPYAMTVKKIRIRLINDIHDDEMIMLSSSTETLQDIQNFKKTSQCPQRMPFMGLCFPKLLNPTRGNGLNDP